MKKIKKLILSLSLVLSVFILLTGCNKGAGEDTLKIGTSGQYYPFTFLDDDGNLQGFEIDVWNEIGSRLGKKIQYTTSEFAGLEGMLDSKKIHTIANQVTINKPREEKYYFTEVYVNTGAQLVVSKDDEDIKSLDDLEGKTIAYSASTNFETSIRSLKNSEKITIKSYDDPGAMYKDLQLGRIDGYVEDKVSIAAYIKDNNQPFKMIGEIIEPIKNAAPFLKNDDNKKLVDEINTTLKAMKSDGKLTEISQKWFAEDVTK